MRLGLGVEGSQHVIDVLATGTILPYLFKKNEVSLSELIMLRTIIKFELFSVLSLSSKWMKPNEI
jgi:hypothetical protein